VVQEQNLSPQAAEFKFVFMPDQNTAEVSHPQRIAALVSYATLSRYSDAALRSCAYARADSREFERSPKWRSDFLRMIVILGIWCIALSSLAWLCLRYKLSVDTFQR